MIRVALLSYQHAYNYGAVFQVAALQQVIRSLGFDCDIIDYRSAGIESQYTLRQLCHLNTFIQDLRANLVLAPFINNKKKNFEHWFSQNNMTQTFTSKEGLNVLNDSYDKFIVGSDQVWNLKCNRFDDSYLLDFVADNKKKISYAASFGRYDIPLDWDDHFSRFLPQFSSISVREERGIELVSRYCNTPTVCTMDPVLLVGKDFWIKRMSNRLINKPYIFVYQLGHDSLIPKYLNTVRDSRDVVFITGHSGNFIYYKLGDKNYSTASPEDFLSLLFYSDYVVTNSFHATALSILFSKHLSVVTKGGQTESYNSRVYSLLNRYGLNQCIVCAPFSKSNTIADSRICDDSIIRFNKDRQMSLEYLKASITNQ